MKKILIILNYYYPYISGVSDYAKMLGEEFAQKGFEVTVLTSNHAQLPQKEYINGVQVIRAPIICKISKGTLSPLFISLAYQLVKKSDIIYLHLPMLESGLLACFIPRDKLYSTYHCDINLSPGLFNQLIVKIMDISHQICLKKCRRIFVTTLDYANHSRFLHKYKDKLIEVYAPVKERYQTSPMVKNKTVIGFCGRIVAEKGLEVLLQAFEIIKRKREDIALWIGGDYENIMGGSLYSQLISYVNDNQIKDVVFYGKIPEENMAEFYSSMDVFILPSINPLEAFGMVQIEAMYCGVPVVASDLFGVRTIIQNTGMGVLHHAGDADDLARAICQVLDNPKAYIKPREHICALYGTSSVAERYLVHFNGELHD